MSTDRTITIGAHAGGLARHQSEYIAQLMRTAHGEIGVHLELIRPPDSSTSLHDDHIAENRAAIGVLHELLRDGDIDLVVHRGFDLRDSLADDLTIGAIPRRDSPYEALISSGDATLDELEAVHKLGVVQLRARAQLLEHRPDLQMEMIEGDVGNWLTALIDEDVDALVGPNAAFERLGLQERVTEIFPPEMIVPAPCSGVMLCVCREEDQLTRSQLKAIHHQPTAHEYDAEVAFVETLGAQWESPIGTLAQCVQDDLVILGFVADASGERILRRGIRAELEDASAIGMALADLLADEGAEELLDGDLPSESESLSGLIAELSSFEEIDPDHES